MAVSYFLGANSCRGFYSLYEDFCSAEGDYLHIIKGGPGTGKSGFMRKIGSAAEKKGYDVEYILCSGDPDSLDGIYIPALHTGWVDGTTPHIIEPRHFGLDSDYVNLGQFCKTPLWIDDIRYVNRLYEDYKGCYRQAYGYLSKGAGLMGCVPERTLPEGSKQAIRDKIQEIIEHKGKKRGSAGVVRRRFFHAVSCKGDIWLRDSINILCKQCYVFLGGDSFAAAAMKIAEEMGRAYCGRLILSPDPRTPEKTEAVLLPELGLSFVAEGFGLEGAEAIQAGDILRGYNAAVPAEAEQIKAMAQKLYTLADRKLSEAKSLHDELEQVYKEAMDFRALTRYTERYIKDLFS